MKHIKLGQHGISHLIIPIVILVVSTIGYTTYLIATRTSEKPKTTPTNTTKNSTETSLASEWSTAIRPVWTADTKGNWLPIPYNVAPAACAPSLTFAAPTSQLSKATAVYYPGQTRLAYPTDKAPTYFSTGSLRFDKSANNAISVTMPFNGYVIRGARYLVGTETQYTFDIANACGMMVRVAGLKTLSASFQRIATEFPTATATSTTLTVLNPVIPFKLGDTIATAVGLSAMTPKTVSFDFGVYDLRSTNAASKIIDYKTAHAATAELDDYALCWVNLLDDKDQATVKALPAGDATVGKKSDYCK